MSALFRISICVGALALTLPAHAQAQPRRTPAASGGGAQVTDAQIAAETANLQSGRAANRSILVLGRLRSVPRLTPLLADVDPGVRKNAADALAAIANAVGPTPVGTTGLPRATTDALGKERNAEVLQSLLGLCQQMRESCAPAVPTMTEMLKNPAIGSMRPRIVSALAAIGAPAAAAIPMIVADLDARIGKPQSDGTPYSGLDSPENDVMFRLAQFGPIASDAVPALVRALKLAKSHRADAAGLLDPLTKITTDNPGRTTPFVAAYTLGMLGPKGAAALQAALKEPDPYTRAAAAWGLGFARTPEAVRTLASFVRDSSLTDPHLPAGKRAGTRYDLALQASRVIGIVSLARLGSLAAPAVPVLGELTNEPAFDVSEGYRYNTSVPVTATQAIRVIRQAAAGEGGRYTGR